MGMGEEGGDGRREGRGPRVYLYIFLRITFDVSRDSITAV